MCGQLQMEQQIFMILQNPMSRNLGITQFLFIIQCCTSVLQFAAVLISQLHHTVLVFILGNMEKCSFSLSKFPIKVDHACKHGLCIHSVNLTSLKNLYHH